ncbi:MAG: dTDP-4-dehydrorhamnose 3,5-epimerase family protein [Oscillospiraceae bacterium]|nr:dTDP-4-dehydrorhamnose 3,5-epimerase family protein [Oscillospiraceae bacterium]
MKRKELALDGCYLFKGDRYVDPIMGEEFFNYQKHADFGTKTVFTYHFEMEMPKPNVLRGFYIQNTPMAQNFMMRCGSGAIEITLLDLRDKSPTYLEHTSVTLSFENGDSIFFPSGVAYAARSLEEDSQLYCMVDQALTMSMNLTINVFDPALNCTWPEDVAMSAIERCAPKLEELGYNYW